MHTSPLTAPDVSGSSPTRPGRLVTDATTRALHGLMAFSFGLAYLSADSETWRVLHVCMGYTFAGAFVMRLAFGWWGPRQARLSLLWRRGEALGRFVRQFSRPQAWSWAWLQQLPLMAVYASLLLLLLAALPITATGWISYESWGPDVWVEWMADLHETLGEGMLLAVFVHLAAVVLQGVWRRSPYWQRMLSGRLPERGPHVAATPIWLAAVITVTLGFWLAVDGGWLRL